MLKKTGIILNIWCLSFAIAQAQLTPRSIMTDRNLYPERLSQMQWALNSNTFYYVKSNTLIAVNIHGKKNEILTLKELNEGLETAHIENCTSFPNIKTHNDSIISFIKDDTLLLLFNMYKKSVSIVNKLPAEAENIDINYVKMQIAYTIDDNLYVSVNNDIISLTKDGGKGIVYGKTVHRNEFGIEKGTFWSPEGKYLAFYKMNESMVTDYPIVIMEDPIATEQLIKYPMAGTSNHYVNIGIYNIEKNQTIYLKTKHWDDQYLTNIAWSPDEQYIYVAVLNRNQKEMMLNQYKASDGSFVKTLFSEKHDKYIEPLTPPYFLGKNPNEFIWQSQRDGYNHLYLYNLNELSCNQLTKGRWVINEIVGYNTSKKILYLIASKETPIETELYALHLKDKTMVKLSSYNGTNSAMLSNDAAYIVNSVNSIKISNKVVLLNEKGKIISTLLEDNPALLDLLSDIEIFKIKAHDDTTDLFCRIIKPKNLDETKIYPVIVYVYGGPHAQMISNSWTGGAGLFLHYLAQNGYIVFTLDNRGSSNRGLAFEQAIFKNVGEVEALDQIKGIEYLKKLSYVDTNRIGVHGWSYGGFMTINLMLKYPDVFKVGVAGGPVCDWKYYEVMYGERYMSTPKENPDGYFNASIIEHIHNLKGNLLVIHGDNDPVVVWQHSLMLLKEAIKKDVLIDYFVYPGHEHNVGGIDRAHLMRKIENYFKNFL